jgi:hypothetical protein
MDIVCAVSLGKEINKQSSRQRRKIYSIETQYKILLVPYERRLASR